LREQITFDGPAASGKSTLAKNVAKELNAFFINTGDMYRTLTWCVRQRGINIATETHKIVDLMDKVNIRYFLENGSPVLFCEGKKVDLADIRCHVITENVSLVASIPEVREWLVARQRESADLGLLVMEGRDIGTVVFPKAKYKFYVTASPEVRAMRRLSQDGEVPEGSTVEKVAQDIARRDQLDMNRKISPLKQAEDAVYIDTSHLNIEQATAKIVEVVKEKQSVVHA
jgi:CMP/dCMP kinase